MAGQGTALVCIGVIQIILIKKFDVQSRYRITGGDLSRDRLRFCLLISLNEGLRSNGFLLYDSNI